MIDSKLLDILVCPDTKQVVTLADESLLNKVNEAITNKSIKNRAEQLIDKKIEAALITEDQQTIYPIRSDIPVMLIDESIPLKQLASY